MAESQPLSVRLRQWIDEFRDRENQMTMVLAVGVGVLVGLVTVAFILVTGRLAARMYPAGVAGWRRILIPTLGSLFTGVLLARYFPFARGSGVPQAKFALMVNDGFIRFRTVAGKLLCCSISLASGIALGREGPSVQVGAGIASMLGRNLGLSRKQVKALLPVGCAAALAAAFNTPIAAVIFTLEEIMGDMHASVLGTAALGSAASWMVLHYFLGDEPLFHVPAYRLVHPTELIVYCVLGVLGGLGSVAFVKLLLGMREHFLRMPRRTVWLQPTVGGLTVGLMGYFLPNVMGVGYDFVDRVLNGDAVLKTVAILAVLKIIAAGTSYASGNAGGIFGPSLFVGAMIGAVTGGIAHMLFPGSTAGPGAYALVGMGTAFAGILRTPFTSVLMIFELTRDYAIIVPLMISNTLAYVISEKFQHLPIYQALAKQDGIHMPDTHSKTRLGEAVTVMRKEPIVLPATLPVADAIERLKDSAFDAWPVSDGGRFKGMIRYADLARAVSLENQNSTLGALLEKPETFPHVHPDQPLPVVLERMGSSGLNVLPVVGRANLHDLMGIVVLDDVLSAYGFAGRRNK
ncbi:MAG TPA: chloride channel protein [Bryobacteraceae bacterium]|nr:chloride channel protein [Bryobacteraceae bacterium]